MMDLVAKMKKMYPNGIYGNPCTTQEIEEAEESLQTKIPSDLALMYLRFNGLEVPGSSMKLYPLLDRYANTSMVGITLFLRAEPWTKDIADILFYGMSQKQYFWGIKLSNPQMIVEYNYDLDAPQVVASTIVEAYKKDEEWVRSLGFGSSEQQ